MVENSAVKPVYKIERGKRGGLKVRKFVVSALEWAVKVQAWCRQQEGGNIRDRQKSLSPGYDRPASEVLLMFLSVRSIRLGRP